MRAATLGLTLLAGAAVACAGLAPATRSPSAIPTCMPSCDGKVTGSDGCGGRCGGSSGPTATCDSGKPLALLPAESSADPGDDFTDPATGHRVVRLSRLENGGTKFYFTQNAFNCRGNKVVFANDHGELGRWLYTVDLETLAIEPIAEVPSLVMEVVAPKRNEVLYLGDDGNLLATNLETRESRSVAQLPAGANGLTINADETLIAGYWNDGLADYQARYPESFGAWFTRYYGAHMLSYVYTVDVDTGTVRRIHEENNWIDHTQFSPTDPALLMFSHEGPADWVTDRMWQMDAIAADNPWSLYSEPVANELVNHEFFSHDGTKVYFDHQVPLDGAYSIGQVDVVSGAVTSFQIASADWGLHYNVSYDGVSFASDGDDRGRKTSLLFHMVDGRLLTEQLADLSGSDYEFQPNVQFTRDDRWVIYQTSHGSVAQVYAVEVAKR